MIRFDQPQMLWLALIALPLMLLGIRMLRGMDLVRRVASVSFRGLLICALAVILASPRTVREHDHLTVVGVVDVSGSVRRFAQLPPLEQLDATSNIDYLRRWLRAATAERRPEDRFGLVAFDGGAVAIATPTRGRYVDDNMDVHDAAGTNIADAIALASAMFPPDTARRLVLISDGNETTGSALDAVTRTAQQLASARAGDSEARPAPIDVAPLAYRIHNDVQVAAVQSEPTARPGQTITVRIILEATAPSSGLLSLTHEGVAVDLNGELPGSSRDIDVPAGRSVQLAQVRLPDDSAVVNRFHGVFEPHDHATDEVVENNSGRSFTITPGRGSVLIVQRDGESRANVLADMLLRAGMDVRVGDAPQFPQDLLGLHSHDLIVLDNVAASEFDAQQHALMRQYVEDFGGGLIMIGGENSFGAGGWNNTAVEEILPLELDPPRELRLPTAALVLVIDKSGSMDFNVAGARATQQEVANEGSALAVRSLRSESLVGVVTFDLGARIVVPLQRNDEPEEIAERIMGISPEGGTNLEPALELAYGMLENVEVAKKRVVCLSDGESESDPAALDLWARKMSDANIKLTTIAIGDDADRVTMQRLANIGGGEFYEVRNPQVLPRVLVDSVQIMNKPLIKETPFTPRVLATGSSLTAGMDAAPELRGMVITSPKPQATAIVEMTHSDAAGEPLLAHWQAGLGRVAAFTSDLGGPWSRNWDGWDRAEAFWLQLARMVTRPPQSRDTELFVEIRDDRLHITLEAIDASGEGAGGGTASGAAGAGFAEYLQVDGTVYSPDNRATPVRLRQVAPGRYETSIAASEAGNYIVAVTPRRGNRRLSPTIGGASLASSPEYRAYQSNLALLEQIVERTGGRRLDVAQPRLVNLFDRTGMPPSVSALPAWPMLLWALLAIALLDVACRRLAWNWNLIREGLRRALALVTPSHVRGRKVATTLAGLARVSEAFDKKVQTQSRGLERFEGSGTVGPPPARLFDERAQRLEAERRDRGGKSVAEALNMLRGRGAGATPPGGDSAGSQEGEAPQGVAETKDDKGESARDTTSSLLAAKRRARQRYRPHD